LRKTEILAMIVTDDKLENPKRGGRRRRDNRMPDGLLRAI